MRPRQALGTIDDECAVVRDGSVLGIPADIEATNGQIRILGVEEVGVPHAAVGEDGNAYVAYQSCQSMP